MNVLQIVPRLYLIAGRNPRFPSIPYCNSFLVEDEVTCLIDTTAGPELLSLAESGRVNRLLHTHLHPDHINYNYLFPEVEVWTPIYASHVLASMEAFLGYSGMGRLGKTVGTYCAREVGYVTSECAATYQDGDVLDFGRTQLSAIHAPGHSLDHMILFHEKTGTLFSNDIDLAPFGPWYANPGSDITGFEMSVRLIKRLAPATLVSSHAPEPITGGIAQALETYIQVIQKRDHRIRTLLAEPRTLEEVVEQHPIFRAYPHPVQVSRQFEREMVRKHLQRLLQSGAIRQEGQHYQSS